MNNKVLHIFVDEKFVVEYIKKINDKYDNQIFYIWVRNKKTNFKLPIIKNIYYSSDNSIFASIKKILVLARECNKIIFHSIIFPAPLLITAAHLTNKYKDKTMWVIWGADLYDHYWERNNSISTKIREFFRKSIIRNVKAIGAIQEDYDVLKGCYGVTSKRFLTPYCFHFPEIGVCSKEGANISILIGNSANPTCQHKGAIDILSKHNNIKAFCILSYPKNNIKYINEIVEYGKQKIGDNFIPILDFMSNDEYMKFLSQIDVAILNNNRQQGWGNIISLLYYGKTLYINKQNILYEHFIKEGAIIYPIDVLSNKDIKLLDFNQKKNNIEVAKRLLSDKHFYECWDKVFTDTWQI